MSLNFDIIKDKYVMNLLFKEEVELFYKHGLLTEEQYNEIIKL